MESQEEIADVLGFHIANLGYPVGCGISPHPETLIKIARAILSHPTFRQQQEQVRELVEAARAHYCESAGICPEMSEEEFAARWQRVQESEKESAPSSPASHPQRQTLTPPVHVTRQLSAAETASD